MIAETAGRYILPKHTAETLFDPDQQTSAGIFAWRKMKLTGILDAGNDRIPTQTIEEVSA
jgi:hypothetical protein